MQTIYKYEKGRTVQNLVVISLSLNIFVFDCVSARQFFRIRWYLQIILIEHRTYASHLHIFWMLVFLIYFLILQGKETEVSVLTCFLFHCDDFKPEV